jgi:hypothetical protein
MFQPFSSSLMRMYSRSMWSRNSRSGRRARLGRQLHARQLAGHRAALALAARHVGDDLLGQIADVDAVLRQDHQRSITLRSSRTFPGHS